MIDRITKNQFRQTRVKRGSFFFGNNHLKKIKADIEIDKMICELEGYNFKEYLDEIKTLVRSYYHA